jgi:5-formyltetrahydrofolate cyclo-ligase
MNEIIASEKASIRSRMKTLRAGLDISAYRTMSMAAVSRLLLLDEYLRAETVHVYVSSLNNEVDTVGLICLMFDSGTRVVVPCCGSEARSLHHVRIESLDVLQPSRFGIMEPECLPGNEVSPDSIDLVIAPVLAFDRTGGRLGAGGGYYDEFFSEVRCPRAGLAYSFQEVPEVPREPHDRTLDIIITEKETIRVR